MRRVPHNCRVDMGVRKECARRWGWTLFGRKTKTLAFRAYVNSLRHVGKMRFCAGVLFKESLFVCYARSVMSTDVNYAYLAVYATARHLLCVRECTGCAWQTKRIPLSWHNLYKHSIYGKRIRRWGVEALCMCAHQWFGWTVRVFRAAHILFIPAHGLIKCEVTRYEEFCPIPWNLFSAGWHFDCILMCFVDSRAVIYL